jgi:phosphoglucosamine mutase
MGKLFGTDGIRGVANSYPVTCELALKIGQAAGIFIKEQGYGSAVIGKDTRISGDMLESALAAGLASTGVNVLLAGIIPTPGIAFLCRDTDDAGAGIVISASHNPYQDNGIKIFGSKGVKLSLNQEKIIENFIFSKTQISGKDTGKINGLSDILERYCNFLRSKFPFRKPDKKLRLVIDCSNGAASEIAHLVFNETVFEASFIYDRPDGKNINKNCGSQHTEAVGQAVINQNADLGLAFDGDADRLIAVDEKGREISGDVILGICAKYAQTAGQLENNIVVSTIMSNIGLTKFLESLGIRHVKSDVGDRNVFEEMKKHNAVIGGEDSGHMISLKDHSTGDGMLSALKLAEIMLDTGSKLVFAVLC